MKKKNILSMLLAVCMLVTALLPQMAVKANEPENGAVVIDVTDFGADPSGIRDSAVPIQKAIAAAREAEGPVILNFPKGEYQVYPDKAVERELYISNTVGADQSHKMKKIGIFLENMEDVVVEGNGSLFNFHGKMMTFAAIGCKNVTFQNYSVDFQVPTVVDITVEKVEENSAVVYVPECYPYQIDGTGIIWKSDASPYTGETYWTGRNSFHYTQILNLKDGTSFRSSNPLFNGVTSIEDLGSNRLKFNYGSIDSSIQEGYCYQMRPTVRDHAGVFLWKSEEIMLKDLDIHFLHGFGMVGQFSSDIHLDGIRFATPEGSGRTTAGYADFLQMSGCKGEIRIENCGFENAHDDPINIHGTFLQVTERIADNKFKVRYMHNETAGFPNFFPGDEVEFMTKGNMIPVQDSTARVIEVSGPTGEGGAADSGTGSLTDIMITLDQDMPKEIGAGTHVAENITYTPSVIVENNMFKEIPTRGILVTTRKKVEIRGNEFDSQGMAAIYISNDAQGWYESGPARDVLIEQNVFRRSGVGTSTQPVIYIDPTNPTVSSDRTVHENIVIRDNVFYMKDNQVLGAKSVKDLSFTGNKIYRYDPGVRLGLRADKDTLVTGESAALSIESRANALHSQLYSFNGCKQVTLADNLYDGGLKKNASLSNMSADELIQGDGEGVVVNGQDSQTSGTGKIYYQSSDEQVLKVSSSGFVQAAGPGKASVTAYCITGGRRYDSEPVGFTVTAGEADNYPEEVFVTADTQTVTTLETRVQYAARVMPEGADASVRWKAVDPKTQEASPHASIDENGLLTPLSSGVAEVVAVTSNGLEDRMLLVIQTEEKSLGSSMEIVSEDPKAWEMTEAGGIRILAQAQGLWDTQTANNIFISRPDADLTHVTAEVKMHGKTAVNYDEAGLIFYKDNDNYVAVERKHGAGNPKVHVVTEAQRNPNEDEPAADVEQEDIYFKLEKNQDQVTGYCSEDGKNWQIVRQVANASLGSEFGIGFLAASGSDSETPFEFSELVINGQQAALVRENTAPQALEAAVQYQEEDGALAVSYAYTDEDGDSQGGSLVKWLVSDTQDGHFRLLGEPVGANVKVTQEMAGRYVKAVVIPRDQAGMYGAMEASEQAVRIGQGGSGEEPWQVKSADARLWEAAFTGIDGFADFTMEENYYVTRAEASQEWAVVSMKAKHDQARIELSLNNRVLIPLENAESEIADFQIPLVSGINVIQARVLAADGSTQEIYRFLVLRKGYNLAEPQALHINGEVIPGFKPEQKRYAYTAQKGANSIRIAAAGVHESAAVSILAGGNAYGDEADIPLNPGQNEVVIRIKPDTSAAPNDYRIQIKVPWEGNANLESVGFSQGVSLDGKFEADIREYTGTASMPNATLSLKAEEEMADIRVRINGRSYGSAKGFYEQELPMSLGLNKVEALVTAPDKEGTQRYTWNITGTGTVYLSDLNYDAEKSFSGYGPTANKDLSTDGNKLTLLNEKGETVAFERGMGTHASAELVYNIEGMGFREFLAYMGADQEISKKEEADMVFRIYVDGEKVYESGTLTGTSPMASARISVEGAKELKLEVDKLSYDYSDHADFADAKFTTGMEPWKEEYTVRYAAVPEAGGSVKASWPGGEDQTGEFVVKEGGSATFTAQPKDNYRFAGWYASSGKKVSVDPVYTISSILENKQYEARFERVPEPVEEYTIHYGAAPAGAGSVTAKCGGRIGEDGVITAEEGQTVVLTADAGQGYRFTGWYDGQGDKVYDLAVYTIKSVGADGVFEARFEKIPDPVKTYKIQYHANPDHGGDVSAESGGVAGKNGSITVEEGENVILTAKANQGYRFLGWFGSDGKKLIEEEIFTIYEVKEGDAYEAGFEKIPDPVKRYTVRYSASPQEGGTIAAVNGTAVGSGGSITAEEGTTVALTAKANGGYYFGGWYKNGTFVSGNPVMSIGRIGADAVYEARFSKLPGRVTGLKCTAKTTSSVSFKWNEVQQAAGYEVWKTDGKTNRFTRAGDTGAAKFTAKKLKAAAAYQYKVRAFVKTPSGMIYGDWSDSVKICTKLKRPSLSIKKRTKNTVTITWKGGTKAQKYQIQRKTGKGNYKNIKDVSGKNRTFTIKRLKKGAACRIRIRGYRKISGQKTYSDYTKAVKVKGK